MLATVTISIGNMARVFCLGGKVPGLGGLLRLLLLSDQGLVDVRDNSAPSYGRSDQRIQFFVPPGSSESLVTSCISDMVILGGKIRFEHVMMSVELLSR